MAKQLVKIINLNTNVEFDGHHLQNANLISHAEMNPDSYNMVYTEVDETPSDKPAMTLTKLMGKSVKDLHKIAAENNISFGVPASHMTKAEIASAIIENMRARK